MTGRIFADDWTTCASHGKRAYTSRKAAKIALDNAHPDDSGMREYPCDVIDGAWHFGHLPRVVKKLGAVAADVYYDRRRSGWTGWRGPQGKGAMRRRREQKRAEAVARSLATPHERMRKHRLGRCDCGRRAAS